MTRRRLANRRAAVTFPVFHEHREFTISIGRFDADPDQPGAGGGDVAEVFVTGPKSGAHLHALLRDAAIITSLALQHGCPLPTLVAALSRDSADSPTSIIGSVVDAMAADCALSPQD